MSTHPEDAAVGVNVYARAVVEDDSYEDCDKRHANVAEPLRSIVNGFCGPPLVKVPCHACGGEKHWEFRCGVCADNGYVLEEAKQNGC